MKAAELVFEGGRWRFAGIGMHGRYGVEEKAVCLRGYPHRVPTLECSCGFWALRSETQVEPIPSWSASEYVFLEVELHGRVIVAELGFRAEHQRVLRATVSARMLEDTRYSEEVDVTTFGDVSTRHLFVERGHAPLDLHEVRRDLPTDWVVAG